MLATSARSVAPGAAGRLSTGPGAGAAAPRPPARRAAAAGRRAQLDAAAPGRRVDALARGGAPVGRLAPAGPRLRRGRRPGPSRRPGPVVVRGPVAVEGGVELAGVEARRPVERVAAAPVRQRQHRGPAHVVGDHLVAAVEGRQDAGGAGADDVAAHAVHAQLHARTADADDHGVGQPDPGQPRAGRGDPRGQGLLVRAVALGEPVRVALELQPPPHDLGADGDVLRSAHLDAQAEPVEQLGPQLPLLGVHRAHEQEARRVAPRDGLALDHADPGGRDVQQQVDQVVGQQVDLVDVEHALMGAGEEPGLERVHAPLQRVGQAEAAHEAVGGRPDGQLDQGRRAGLPGGVGGHGAGGRQVARGEGERLAGRRPHRRQQRREPPDRGRLRRPALAAHQHPAHLGRDRVDQEGLDERVLPHDGAQGVRGAHAPASSSSPSSSR